MIPDIDLEAGLKRIGYAAFRPGQREALGTLLGVGRLLLVAPTGGGKSLTYQLPGSLLPGTTLVVSPLVSLMQDQVLALDAQRVPASFLAATLNASELSRRMAAAARGEYKLLYVAPERLPSAGFRALLRDLECPLVAVDEAHCISEWGHDFRPDYLQIGELLAGLPDAYVLACTATATPVVRDEVVARLGLPADTPQLVHGFARPNLALRSREVESRKRRDAEVDAALAETLGGPGRKKGVAIVYSATRKSAESEAERLTGRGWSARVYHAGLPPARRDSAHRAFAEGALDVVVATNAFGMGIDRADVRAVVHLAPPASIESYYQEVGRAGRDGQPALGLLLISPGDLALRRRLIEGDAGPEGARSEIVRHKWNLFLELMRWSEGGSCRHDAILRYFGDEAETLAGCGRCDVCELLAAGGPEDDAQPPDRVAELVRKGLSGVARIHGRFGLQAAVKLLRGAEDARLTASGLRWCKTFGVLADHPETWITRLLRRLVTAGWVELSQGDRPVAMLSEEGVAVMRGDRPAALLLPPRDAERSAAIAAPSRSASRPPRRRVADLEELDGDGQQLFEALRRHRLEVARAESVPPYVVASDRTLRSIARLRPRDRAQLEAAHGIGPARARRYGRGFLEVVNGPNVP